MKTEKILSEITECIINADLIGLDKGLDLLLQATTDELACKELSQILCDFYTPFKSDYLATVVEIIIKRKRTIALVSHPTNFLFQTIISTGSYEMYECLIEEAVVPHLTKASPEEQEIYFLELQNTAQELSNKLFKENIKCIKGKHYNGAYSKLESNKNVVLINEEDYNILEDVVNRYNTIIGRRDIIKDLTTRSGLD